MKKALMSLMVVALVATLVGVGTFAVFSDTETSEENIMTTGTVDVTLHKGLGNGMEFKGMAPGDEVEGVLRVHNNGSLPIYVAASVVDVKQYVDGGAQTADNFIDNFTVKVHSPRAIREWGPEDLSTLVDDPMMLTYPHEDPLAPGESADYTVTFILDLDTDNVYQDAILKGKVKVDAVQSDNYSWDDAKDFLEN